MQDAIDALHTRMARRVRRARAHDLNGIAQNIVSAALGIRRVLKNSGLLDSDERLQKCLQWIESSSTKIAASGTELLPLQAQEAAATVRFDYAVMLAECARLARDELNFADVTIELQGTNEPCSVSAKAEQIRDCVLSLIFACSDLAKRPGTVRLACRLQDRFVTLEAGAERDTGRNTLEHNADLIVAREIARAHGGDLTISQNDTPESPLLTLRLPFEAS